MRPVWMDRSGRSVSRVNERLATRRIATKNHISFLGLLLLSLLGVGQIPAQRVASYNPPQTTVGYLPGSNLNVLVTLQSFTVPPAPRLAYFGGNAAQGGIPLTIVGAETGTSQFIVAIPPALRESAVSRPIVLCQRINLGGGAIDGACTNRDTSAAFVINAPPSITTASPLTAGTRGVVYSRSFAATGGTGARSWTLRAGTLPPGLTLGTTGVLNGTPTAAGTYGFTVRVTDSLGIFNDKAFSVTIAPAIQITTAEALPIAMMTRAYSIPLNATGGIAPYTWTLLSPGDIPAGLSVNTSTGVVSGTPTVSGSFKFAVQVNAAGGGFVSKTFTINILQNLVMTNSSTLPSGMVGRAYSRSFSASGGSAPLTWQVAPGTALPPGLSISASGVVSGTPTSAGAYKFTLQVQDSVGFIATRIFEMEVVAALSITSITLPGGSRNVAYSATLAGSGGTTPYVWSLSPVAGSLPPGLSLSTSGALTGTPSTNGSYTFVVRLRDAQSYEVTRSFTIQVLDALVITTATPLPGAVRSSAYNTTIVATGGQTPYAWTATGLPAGLSLNNSTGALTGTPTVAGDFSFNVQVRDNRNVTSTKNFAIRIADTLAITSLSELPDAALGASYSTQLAASGGTTPYSWQVLPGTSLPTGLTLSSAGAISGTPGQSGTFNLAIQVRDANNSTASRTFSLRVASGLSISTPSVLEPTSVGRSYLSPLSAVGGNSPYQWQLAGGASMPAGLTLNSGTGAISGTPTASGNFSFAVQVRDSDGATANRTFTLSVNPQLAITSAPVLPVTGVGSNLSEQLVATGGFTPYVWSLAPGSSLPAGLALSPGSGLITGSTTQPGEFSFVVRVDDARGAIATRSFTLTVVDSLVITTSPQLPNATVNANYAVQISASNGLAPYSWSLLEGSALPAGLMLNPNTGAISGTPSVAGEFQFGIVVTDTQESSASRNFTLVVSSGLSITTPSLLPDGALQTAYSVQLTANNGTTPYSWQLSGGGQLPTGLTLQSANGLISGTPTAAGTYQFNISVADAQGLTASRAFTLMVSSPSETLSITTSPQLPNAPLNTPYTVQLSASNGSAPYNWYLGEGSSLPVGLSLASSGAISGTPTQAGTFAFTAFVSDSQEASASRTFQLTVTSGLVFVTDSALPAGTVGTAVSIALSATGGTGAVSYAVVESTLPPGITLSAQGALSGAPTATFDGSIRVRATDSGTVPSSVERVFTWRIANPLTIQTETMPDAIVGESYSVTLAVQGGRSPYTFVVTEGRVAPGLTVGENGIVSGSAVAAGEWAFTIRVTDADGRTATRNFPIRVMDRAPISASISPQTPQPGSNTQQPISVALAEANTEDVTGELIATFAPSTNPPVDDPAIQFVSGGRVASFRIPAGQTNATFGDATQSPALQMGTVAGEIRLALRLTRNGQDVTPSPAPSTNLTLPASAPVISDLRVTRTATGLSIVVRGYSNARSMQSASLQFAARAGSNITGSLQFTVDLANVFTTWYGQTDSFPHGSRFQLTIPANITGDTADINGLTIRLRNAQGESAAASATF